MVKSSGKVVLQTGGRGKSLLPGNRYGRPACVVVKRIHKKGGLNKKRSVAVSYTHLTLPTILLV